jgi:hypothetical protein
MIAAERYTCSRCAESDRLSLPAIGDEALILVGIKISDAALRNLCISCKSLSPGSRGKAWKGIRKELLGHRTDVLDDLTALTTSAAIGIFASAEKRMLESYLLLASTEGSSPEEPSVGYRFVELYSTLRPEELRKLHKEFIQGVVVPAEEGLRTLEAYAEDCTIVGPAVHLQVKGSYPSRCGGSHSGPLYTPRMSSVVVGFRTLRKEDSFKGFLKAVFSFVRPELPGLPTTAGRPTWTKSLAITKGGGTCSNEAKDNTAELIYSGLMCPLSRTMDHDQFLAEMFKQPPQTPLYGVGHSCWWTVRTPGHRPTTDWYTYPVVM